MRPLKSSVVVAAWPKDHNRHRQPYTHMLYRAVVAAAPRLKVLGYRPTRLPPRADLVHVHWPDTTLGHPNPWLAWVLTLRTLILLYVFRLRGALVVWTAHNLSGHNAENRRFLAAVYWWVFSRLVDGCDMPEQLGKKLPSRKALHSSANSHSDWRRRRISRRRTRASTRTQGRDEK